MNVVVGVNFFASIFQNLNWMVLIADAKDLDEVSSNLISFLMLFLYS
jgi:hypothetical protein